MYTAFLCGAEAMGDSEELINSTNNKIIVFNFSSYISLAYLKNTLISAIITNE